MIGFKIVNIDDGLIDFFQARFIEFYLDCILWEKLGIDDYKIVHYANSITVEMGSDQDLTAVILSGLPNSMSSKLKMIPIYEK